jgi:solute carrier family 39 (zinc transporter), member 1/2/3
MEEHITPLCGDAVDHDNKGLRVASIFILLAASLLGALLPIFSSRGSLLPMPRSLFFICKHTGTGVIIATAWMHLLSPAVEALHHKCLAARLGDYDWAFAIGLMTVMAMFLMELVATNFGSKGLSLDAEQAAVPPSQQSGIMASEVDACTTGCCGCCSRQTSISRDKPASLLAACCRRVAKQQGQDESTLSALSVQLTAIFILEFGVVFHSIFIGLVLSTTRNLVILTVVFTFHQLFEGLGLGSRLALALWPASSPWWPYLLATIFGLSSPLAAAAGIATKSVNAETHLLVTGIFDSISAGILMYTGLVELLGHEFLFNMDMRRLPLRTQLYAFACIAFGATVMAVLALWA